MGKILSLINEHAYSTFLNWASNDDKHLNSVHIARFNHPQHGRCKTYVKMFPFESGKNRGLINEITGYLLAHASGIPQPDFAFIAKVPVSKISNPPAWLTASKSDFYPAFCTKRLDGKAAAFKVPDTKIAKVRKAVEGWQHLPFAVSLDECASNTDRHFNNLIRLGNNKFAVIDSDRLASIPPVVHWVPSTLQYDYLYRNRLSEHLWDHKPKEKMISQIMSTSAHTSRAFDKVESEIDYWAGLLLSDYDKKAFMSFLSDRSKHLDLLLRQRYHRLL